MLKNKIYSSKLLLAIINVLFRLKNKSAYLKEVKIRVNYDLFNDYLKLAKDLPYYPFDYLPDNNLYGISYSLKKYMEVSVFRNIDAHFEHGLYLGHYVQEISKISYAKKIVTFGLNRKKHLLKNMSKKVLCIGPYIKYAKSLLNLKEIQKIKDEFGKTLLVFPSHSIKGLNASFDSNYFLNQIKAYNKEYSTVIICLYYADVKNKSLVTMYQNMGAKIVCAGHKYDCHFLSRLRSIIEISDFTISNNVGTHIGYAIALGKQHKIIQQDVRYRGDNSKEKNKLNLKGLEFLEIDKKAIINSLDNNNFGYNDIIEAYWGNSFFCTKEEMKNKLFFK